MTTTDVATHNPTDLAKPDEFPALATKPLNATQTRNLQKIVSSDFDELESQLRERITQQFDRRKKQVAEKYGDDDTLDVAKEEAQALYEKLSAEVIEWESSMAVRGLTMQGHGHIISLSANFYHLSYVGNEEAMKRLGTAKETLMRMALHYVASLRRAAERKILLASLQGSAANDMLGSIPQLDEALQSVLGKLTDTAAEQVAELLGDEPIQ